MQRIGGNQQGLVLAKLKPNLARRVPRERTHHDTRQDFFARMDNDQAFTIGLQRGFSDG